MPGVLEVSPNHKAHYPGCSHKDDPDFGRWGLITKDTALAWQALGNHQPVAADSGGQPGLVAKGRCITCDDHGPWL